MEHPTYLGDNGGLPGGDISGCLESDKVGIIVLYICWIEELSVSIMNTTVIMRKIRTSLLDYVTLTFIVYYHL